MVNRQDWSPVSALLKPLAVTLSAICLLSSGVLSTASALTINRTFVGGIAPTVTTGGGDIVDIFNTAADWWEASILDSHTLDIDFGWDTLAGNTLGSASTTTSVPITTGLIRFDNDRTDWFLDATPTDDADYQTFTETSQDLGGGVVNTSRQFDAFFGDAFGRFDLLTVAAHEIGHLLGVVDVVANPLPDPFLITSPRPNAGTLIDTVALGGGHLSPVSYPNTLMNPFVSRSVRRSQSTIDILAAAERTGFVDLNLDPLAPSTVAEPAPLAMITFGLLTAALVRRRQARDTGA